MSRKFFVKDTDYATGDTAGVVKVGSGLRVNNGILSADNGGVSGSCIVCSPTQPTNLKKGLWIETEDSEKDINIINLNAMGGYLNKMSSTLSALEAFTSACAIDGKAYIFGGYQYSKNSNYYNYIQCYNPTTDTRTTKQATLNGSVRGSSACAIDGKAYIFGGYLSNSSYCNYIQCYDPVSDTRTLMSSTLVYAMYVTSACAIDGKAYIFGGNSTNNSYCNYIQCYDPISDICTLKSSTLVDRMDSTSACAIDGKAYIFGGYSGSNRLNYIQCYDPISDICTLKSSTLVDGMASTSACAIDGKAYIFGGDGLGNVYYDYIQCYDPILDTCFMLLPTLVDGMYGTSACAIDGRAYIFGGLIKGNYINYIQRFENEDKINIEEMLLNSILVLYNTNNEGSLIALNNMNNTYYYNTVNEVYNISSDKIASRLPYHKIENYQVIN